MRIFGVDPGPKQSGWCYMDLGSDWVSELKFGHSWNRVMLTHQSQFGESQGSAMTLAYEWVKNYGRVVGEDVLRTAYTCGRIRELGSQGGEYHEVTRPDVIKHFTGRTNLPKSEVRKELLDRFGGAESKKKGGILAGISNHAWDALAVCIYVCEDIYDYAENYWRSRCQF